MAFRIRQVVIPAEELVQRLGAANAAEFTHEPIAELVERHFGLLQFGNLFAGGILRPGAHFGGERHKATGIGAAGTVSGPRPAPRQRDCRGEQIIGDKVAVRLQPVQNAVASAVVAAPVRALLFRQFLFKLFR